MIKCRSFYLSLEIKKALKNKDQKGNKIALICPNGASYVIGQWAIWMSGNTVVPITSQLSENALEFFIKDSGSSLIVTAPSQVDKVWNKADSLISKLKFLYEYLGARGDKEPGQTGSDLH